MSKLPLTDLILTLREELQQAQEQGREQNIAFEVQEIELEVALVAEEDKGANFGVKLFALDIGVKGSQRDVASHRLRLKLRPFPRGEDEEASESGAFAINSQRTLD